MKRKFFVSLAFALVLTGTAFADFAPLNPEFLKWQEELTSASTSTVTETEYKRVPSQLDISHLKNVHVSETFPVKYDPRETSPDLLPPVRDQSGNGTCWAFAVIGALEANYLKQGFTFLGDNVNLSEMYLAWYAYNNPDTYKAFNFQKNARAYPIDILQEGGTIHDAAAIMARLDGPVLDSDLEYTTTTIYSNDKPLTVDRYPWWPERKDELEHAATKDDPLIDTVGGHKVKFTNGIYLVPSTASSPSDFEPALRMYETIMTSDMTRADNEGNANIIKLIKRMITRYGAVNTGFQGRDECLYVSRDVNNNVIHMTYANPEGKKTSWNHYVLAVGWDDDYPRENFSSADINANPEKFPKSNGAWLVQNSWGKDDGEKGYFWISYEEPLHDIAAFIVGAPNDKIRHYGYDDLGWTNSFNPGKEGITTAYMASVFTVEGDYEKICEAGLYLTDTLQSYDINVYDLGEISNVYSPVNGEPLISEKREGIKQSGYYTHQFEKAVLIQKGHKFSIVVKMTTANYKYPLAVESYYQDKHANVIVNSGESFFSSDGTTWTDGYDVIMDDKAAPANACLKAFTSIPDESLAEDWEINKDGDNAQIMIKLLREDSPDTASAEGTGITDINAAIEADNDASTGGYNGKFYTLKISCKVIDSNNAAITKITIKDKVLYTSLASDSNLASEGILLDNMTEKANNEGSGKSSGHCNSGFSALTIISALGLAIFFTRRKHN